MIHARRFFLAGAASLLAAVGAYAADANVTGTWKVAVESPRGTRESTLVLTQQGETVTGTNKGQRGEVPVKGTIKGNALNLSYTVDMQGNSMEIKYAATVDGDTMTGTVAMGQMGEGKFTGKKQP